MAELVANIKATVGFGSGGWSGVFTVVQVASPTLKANGEKVLTALAITFTTTAVLTVSGTVALSGGSGTGTIVPGTTKCKSGSGNVLVKGDKIVIAIAGVNPSGAPLSGGVTMEITDAGQTVLTTG